MSDSRNSEIEIDSNNEVRDHFIKFYELILPFYSSAQTNPAKQVSEKLIDFLKAFNMGESYKNKGSLKGQIGILTQGHPEWLTISKLIIDIIDHDQEEQNKQLLTDAINNTQRSLIDELEDKLKQRQQNVQVENQTSINIPLKLQTGLLFKDKKAHLKKQHQLDKRSYQLKVVPVQNYLTQMVEDFKPFFENLSKLNIQPDDLSFLEGSEIYAILNNDGSVRFKIKLGVGSSKPEFLKHLEFFKKNINDLSGNKVDLLPLSMNLDGKKHKGITLLMLAACLGQNSIILALIKTPDIYRFTSNNKSAFHFACQFNQIDSVKLLMQSGLLFSANPDPANPSMLDLAIENENINFELIDLLFHFYHYFNYTNAWNKLKEFDQSNSSVKKWLDFFEMVNSLIPDFLTGKMNEAVNFFLLKIKQSIFNRTTTPYYVVYNIKILEDLFHYSKAMNALNLKTLFLSDECLTDNFFTEEMTKNIIKFIQNTPNAVDMIVFASKEVLQIPIGSTTTINSYNSLTMLCHFFERDNIDLNDLSSQTLLPHEILKKLYDHRLMLFKINTALTVKASPSSLATSSSLTEPSTTSANLPANPKQGSISTSSNAMMSMSSTGKRKADKPVEEKNSVLRKS